MKTVNVKKLSDQRLAAYRKSLDDKYRKIQYGIPDWEINHETFWKKNSAKRLHIVKEHAKVVNEIRDRKIKLLEQERRLIAKTPPN